MTATMPEPVDSDKPGAVAVAPEGAPEPAAATTSTPAGGHQLGRGYWALLWAMFVANLGSGITVVAFPWLASELTRDPLLVSGVAMAAELPWLLFSLPAGVWVDRYDHRRLISTTHIGRALIVGLLAVAIVTDVTSVWMVYLVAFAIGALTVLNENASQTILPRLVRPAQLNRANSNLMLADTVGGAFLGPGIGGGLLLISLTLPFVMDAGLYVVAAGLILLVSTRARGTATAAPAVEQRSLRREMAEGLHFFWNHRVLRQLGIFLGLLNLGSAVIVGTQVLFAQVILDLNAAQYGALFALGAVGAGAGAGLAPMLEERLGPRRVLLLTLAGNSAVSLTIGFTSSAFVVGVALAVAAGLAVVWNVVTISYRQRVVPEHMLGRANSIYRLLAWGPLAVGSIIGGALVKAGTPFFGEEGGLRFPLFVSGTLTAGLTLYALLRLRDGIWSSDPAAIYPDDSEEEDVTVDERTPGPAQPTDASGQRLPAFGGTGGTGLPVLKSLVWANVVVAAIGLVLIALDEGLTPAGAIWDGVSSLHLATEMSGEAVDRGEVWRLITASFVHYGVAHLLANMVMLVLAARRLEPLLGSGRFLVVFLLSGLGGGVATYLFDHGSLTAGASGANFGVFSALLVAELCLRRKPVLAASLVLFGVVTTFAIPGMAIAAHAAGLLVGTVLALGYALPRGDRRGQVQRAVPIAVLVVLVVVATLAILL